MGRRDETPNWDAFVKFQDQLTRLEKTLGCLNGRLMTLDGDAICDVLCIDVYEGDGGLQVKHQRWTGSPLGIVKMDQGRRIVTQKYHDGYWCKYTMKVDGENRILTSKSRSGKDGEWRSRGVTEGFTLNAAEWANVVVYAKKLLPAVKEFNPERTDNLSE